MKNTIDKNRPIVELNDETKIPVEVHEVQCPKCGEWLKVMKDAKK